MIISLAKKIFPLCPCLALLIACGKKVEDGKSTTRIRPPATLPDAINLEATATSNYYKLDDDFNIPRDGDIELPVSVPANAATGAHKLSLEVNIQEGEYEFECEWVGTGTEYRFDNCHDIDGRDLGLNEANIESFSFPVDQGKALKLKLSGAPASTTTTAQLKLPVIWK